MYIPIRCTCGKNLAPYWELFVNIRARVMQEKLGEFLPEMLPSLNTGEQPQLREVFDQLHVTRECCRVLLMTNEQMSDRINAP